MPTVLILSKRADIYVDLLHQQDLPNLEIVTAPEHFSRADVALGEPSLIRSALPGLDSLRWAQSIWAGVEPLLEEGLRRDYVLTNARGVFGRLMSEYVLTYLLMHERKVLQRWQAQQARHWDGTDTGSLRDKTIGLLGVGSIGAEVARFAKFFEINVHGYTRASADCAFVDVYAHPPTALEEFVRPLDYLVNILPNTPRTRKLITASVLQALPAHALFLNVGRGAAVDEFALAQALKTGAIAGAILDVFEQEPLPAENPLWDAPNLFITSHSAAPSLPGDIARLFGENYRRYVAGEPLTYVVDFARGY
jgi:phosphoglycerate dehydrogenase-like enzyme